jgi:hypothetical protein
MLTAFSKAMRLRMATAVAAAYALCVLMPAAALAFNDAPCLTDHHGFMQPQVHASAAAQQHAPAEHTDHQHAGHADHASAATSDGGDDAQAPAAKCCGMAFFAGVAPDAGFTPAALVFAGRTGLAIKQALAGLPPDQLIRPPKSLS